MQERSSSSEHAGSKQIIKSTLSELARACKGLMKGKIKGSGWLDVDKYRRQRLKSFQ
jgi:hypothetical protein